MRLCKMFTFIMSYIKQQKTKERSTEELSRITVKYINKEIFANGTNY